MNNNSIKNKFFKKRGEIASFYFDNYSRQAHYKWFDKLTTGSSTGSLQVYSSTLPTRLAEAMAKRAGRQVYGEAFKQLKIFD